MNNADLPFPIGKTFYNGGTIDSNNLGGAEHEGREFQVKDEIPAAGGIMTRRSGRIRHVRCVRNKSGIALLPKRLATEKAGTLGCQVDGYGCVGGQQPVYLIDEFLPAAGVPNNDLFYVVTKGPATGLSDLAAGANNPINQGDALVALTAVTSQATTAGRIVSASLTGTTVTTSGFAANFAIFGFAMSAKTTANTNADVLIEVAGRF